MMTTDSDHDNMISFGDGGDDDDDDMLDLFSFGAETSTTPSSSDTNGGNTKTSSSAQVDYSEAMKSVMPLPPRNDDNDDKSQASEDSFIELLEQQQKKTTSILDTAAAAFRKNIQKRKVSNNGSDGSLDDDDDPATNDSDMQDILDWLDNDDELQVANANEEEELVFMEPPRPPTLAESIPKPEPPPPPPKVYDSLEEAVKDHDSTPYQIRRSLEKENFLVSPQVRPWLWAKVIVGKTLEETLQSSIADSYQQWEEQWKANENSVLSAVSLAQEEESNEEQAGGDGGDIASAETNKLQAQEISEQARKREWLEEQSKVLATRIVKVMTDPKDLETHQQDLFAILMNHEGSRPVEEEDEAGDHEESLGPSWKDPLLPPIACAILSGGVPKVAAAVMLSQIISKFMPIVSLNLKERQNATGFLHQFYLLCGYHLPLLVLHLDKYIPEWYKWPPKGDLPQSWLVCHFAGEARSASMLNPQLLLSLWDLILTSSNNSLRFFLVLALLDSHAERLLLLTGDDLTQEFHRVITFWSKEGNGVLIDNDADLTNEQANKCIRDWSDSALRLWEETPKSVTQKLKRVEDETVTTALIARQEAKEERLRLKLESEEKARQEAIEAERERKEDEARLRLTRARLVVFYRERNPGRETNIDKIMETYKGRYDVLDAKLKQKYGAGFNPALKPKPVSRGNNKILSTMNTGFGGRRGFGMRKEDVELTLGKLKKESVVVEVAASEVLPVICWSKEGNQVKIQKLQKSSKLDGEGNQGLPLKFYLVDCRPESSVLEQGRIPSSVSFVPIELVGKDKLKAQEEMFESLRGAVHICVMGEGFAALPEIYGHKLTKGLAEFIKADEKRIRDCALFFLSGGFPFVSVLEGGFAAAHAYLCRDGPKVHLHARNVLTDYDPEESIFAQFERAKTSTGKEKAQRSLQHMFDSGMTALTKSTMRFETTSSEVGSGNAEDQPEPKGEPKHSVRRFFGGNREENEEKEEVSKTETPQPSQPGIPFRNPFARKGQASKVGNKSDSGDLSTSSTHSESKEPNVESLSLTDEHQTKAPIAHQTGKEDPGASTPAPPKPQEATNASQRKGGFSGLGSALNNSMKAAHKPQTARNPFARFGGLGSNAAAKKTGETKGPGMANHLAGLNQFRKNTMATVMKNMAEGSQKAPQAAPHDASNDSGAARDASAKSDEGPTDQKVTPPPEPTIAKI
ncbi:MAG: hypothetical protein SGILL_004539 [Bacillariaceae sp.]